MTGGDVSEDAPDREDIPGGDAPEESDDGRIRWLEPRRVSLFRDAAGCVRATVAGLRSVLRPTLHRAFPITRPDSYVELREEGGEAVGMLVDIEGLDAPSRELAAELLRERYLVPVVTEIRSIRSEFGAWVWSVTTDRGEREFTIKSPRDDIRPLPVRSVDGRLVRCVRVTDVEGNTYEIRDLDSLPARSRAQYGRIA